MTIPTTVSDAPKATDPRVVRSREAIINAAAELLIERGPQAVTVDAVVAESGVAKTTLYRHWASRDDLLYDAFLELCPTPGDPPLHDGFVVALRGWLDHMVEVGNDERWRRAMPALNMMKDYDDRCRSIHNELAEGFETTVRGVLDVGVAEGLVSPETSVDQALRHLLGPLMYCQQRDAPLDDGLVEEVVARFLASEAASRDVDADPMQQR